MRYIEDMWPETILDRNKWHDWFEMYDIQKQCMESGWDRLNWNTHKRLLDAGGLGPVVYIVPARGQCKLWAELALVERLEAEGRKVVYVRPGEKLVGDRKPWVIPDRDILTPERWERAERILNDFLERRNQ